jgi:hypothetical protein
VRYRQEPDGAGGGATCGSRRGPVQVDRGRRAGAVVPSPADERDRTASREKNHKQAP